MKPFIFIKRCKVSDLRSKIAEELRFKAIRYRPYVPKRSIYLKMADLFIQGDLPEKEMPRLFKRIDRFEFENKCKV